MIADVEYRYPCSSLISLELDIALVFDKSGMPRHLLLLLRQLTEELAVGRPIECRALERSIRLTLIGIEKPVQP